MVSTTKGDKPIETVMVGDMVNTPIGKRKVIRAGISGHSNNILEVALSNGNKLVGTADHKVYVVGKGLVQLKDLCYNDLLVRKNISKVGLLWQSRKLFIKESRSEEVGGAHIIDRAASTLSRDLTCSTEKFTKTTSAKSLLDTMSTTLTTTATTTTPQTWLPFPSCSMPGFTIKSIVKPLQLKSVPTLGTTAKKGKKSFEKMRKKCEIIPRGEGKRAQIVELLLRLTILHKFSAGIAARIITFGEKISKHLRFAPSAEESLERLIRRLKPVRIVAVGNSDAGIVYNLTVEEAHLYYANDVLVTNTRAEDHAYDALKYLLTSVGDYKKKTPITQTVSPFAKLTRL
jgi:hypothetical protein